ncbi:MAG: helicase C-terminal domain-containing protein [Candidatus Helarchaeota archaeon]
MTELKIPPEVKLYFPFTTLRAGQAKAINQIFNALNEEKHIVIAAPNGFGKTITVLSAILPVVKGSESQLKVIYLCRTHVQAQHVIRELEKVIKQLKAQGIETNIGGLSLRGRVSMCFHPQVLQYAQDPLNAQLLCRELRNLNRCQFNQNLQNKSNELKDLLQKLGTHAVDASDLLEICRDWEFCPYQVSKLALCNIDIVIGSYVWLFEPFIREFFLENIGTSLNNVVLILDEAHNVPEVATEIASSQLTYFAVEQMIREAEKQDIPSISAFGNDLLEIMDGLRDKIQDEIGLPPHLTFKKVFQHYDPPEFIKEIIKAGEILRSKKLLEGQNPRSFLYSCGMFWMNWYLKQNFNSYFFCASKYNTRAGTESLKFEIVGLDPKLILKPIIEQVYTSISISGTLEPIHYYSDIIGLPESTIEMSLPTPFPEKNLLVLSMKRLSTKGDSRTADMYKRYISRCIEAIEVIPKNVGIFTASYDVLNGLIHQGMLEALEETGKKVFYEQRNRSSEQNDRMIAQFKRCGKTQGGVLLGVCGGRNAEGEDFPGDLMNGVILCGIPFAKPTARIKAMIEYFGGLQRGKDYAYNMPAFRRANQAAGRPIRTLNDRGVIILLDYRYNIPFYKKFLSSWLRNKIRTLPDEPDRLAQVIRNFWQKPKE